MPIGGKSVGRDLSFTITGLNGPLVITPDLVGSYTADPESEWKEWLPITGIAEDVVLPLRWGGTIDLIRKGPLIDQFWALFEAAYYNGVTVQPAVMIETIQEPDGSISQFSYINTLFRLTKDGDWKGNEFVMQTLEWRASRRLPI
jgi:hypothetical protein